VKLGQGLIRRYNYFFAFLKPNYLLLVSPPLNPSQGDFCGSNLYIIRSNLYKSPAGDLGGAKQMWRTLNFKEP
jgi:hypothetical protein